MTDHPNNGTDPNPTPRWRVLVTAPYMQPVLDRFRPELEAYGVELVVPRVKERMEEQDLLPLVGDVDGVISGDDRFTRRVIEAAPRLKVISKWGTGIDSIDQDACREKGIAVRNTPNAFSAPVADSAIGYILAFARNLHAMDRHMKDGMWYKIPGYALSELTIGIVGVGNVGQAVARRLAPFGARILGTDPVMPPSDIVAESGIEMVSLSELLAESDFVTLHCDLNPSSRYLMNSQTFDMMKKTAYLINTARGEIVDEEALVGALQSFRIAGAALDVFEDEPLPHNSPLIAMRHVLLAPHNSNSSPTAWEAVHRSTIDNLLAALKASMQS